MISSLMALKQEKTKKGHCFGLNRCFDGPKMEKNEKRAIVLALIAVLMALKWKKTKKGPWFGS